MENRRSALESWIGELPEGADFLADAVRRAVGDGDVYAFHISDMSNPEIVGWFLTDHAFAIVNATNTGATRVSLIGLSRIQRVLETVVNGFVSLTVETDVERSSAVTEVVEGLGTVVRTYPTGYTMAEPIDAADRVASLQAFLAATHHIVA